MTLCEIYLKYVRYTQKIDVKLARKQFKKKEGITLHLIWNK